MNDQKKLAQGLYDYIYLTLQAGRKECEEQIAAIDTGDHDRIRKCGIDTYYLRHSVDFALERKRLSGQLEVMALLLDTGFPESALRFGLNPFPIEAQPVSKLQVIVDNTKQEPRRPGAHLSPILTTQGA